MPDSRRGFLSKLGLTTATLSSLPRIQADPLDKGIGIQLYTVMAELAQDFNGTIKKIAEIGYKEVELSPTFGKTAAELKTIFGDNGLTCRSTDMFVVTSFNPPPEVAAKFTGANADMGAIIEALEGMTLDDYKKGAEAANQVGD